MKECIILFQLLKERERLDAMMTHLRMEGKGLQNGMDTADSGSNSASTRSSTSFASNPRAEVIFYDKSLLITINFH